MTPKVSVIVPIYNVESYIAQCLDSLLHQTMRNIEIICVDDCGTDKSMQIVEKIAAKSKRVKIIHHDKNKGLSAARNTGMAIAEAPYIMFCDSDDFFELDMCAKMVDAIEKSQADVAICAVNVIYEADEFERASDKKYFSFDSEGTHEMDKHFRCYTSVIACNKIFRRDIIEQHKCEFPVGLRYEDEYFWRVYSLWCKTIYTIPAKLYNYRPRPGSIMNQTFAGLIMSGKDCIQIGTRYFDYLTRAGKNLNPSYTYEFWSTLWPSWVGAAYRRCMGNKQVLMQIKLDIANFVAKNYAFGTGNRGLEKAMRQMQDGCYIPDRRKLFGLFRIKNSANKRQFRICGIPVWIVRYSDDKTRYYLLGCPVMFRSERKN